MSILPEYGAASVSIWALLLTVLDRYRLAVIVLPDFDQRLHEAFDASKHHIVERTSLSTFSF